MTNLKEIIPFLIPLIILQLSLQVYSMINLVHRRKVRFNNKIVWGVIILVFQWVGAVVYLVFRGDDE